MATKHTPGPWIVTEAIDGTLQPFQKDTNRHLLSSEGKRPFPRRTREYNAVLMAQAPELLRLLKEAYARLDDLSPDRFDNAEHEENWLNLMASIRATINEVENP